MRRGLLAAVVIALLGLSVPVLATEGSTGNYKDKFDSIGWAGSNGSLTWSGPWAEIRDDGDEKEGAVRVVSSGYCASGNCIGIDTSLLELGGSVGVRRTANTNVLLEPALCFDLTVIPGLPLGSVLTLQVSGGGSGWVTLEQWDLGSEFSGHVEFDVSEFRANSFRTQFLVNGILNTSQVYIDNVEISGGMVEPTTTTTSSTTTIPDDTTTTTKDEPTTTTTQPRSTTTTRPTTSTTEDGVVSSSTTIVEPDTTTTTTAGDDESPSTLVVAVGGGDGPGSGGSGGPGDGSGLRQTARGFQANFDSGLFGQVGGVDPLLGLGLDARFSSAAEIIESTWVWMVLLAILVAWSIVTTMDRRRSLPDAQ